MKNILLGALAAICLSQVSFAQDEKPYSVDGYVGVTSDYRDRGLSLSDKDPTIMASVGLYHDNGFYVGGGVAAISESAGGDAKANLYAGYNFDADGFTYDLSVELDSIHGGDSSYYPEITGTVSRDFGLAFIRTGVTYAVDGRWSAPDSDSFYVFADLEVPVPTIPELTIISRLGYDMRQDRANLWDWGIGLSAFIDTFELTLMYEDSSLNGPRGSGAIIGGLKFYF
ncbi:TorF family putative porin [Kordiimonas aestuarii]|uniref:TorF family putative porin n=1 Tax=Kordiimonas aestuarii TaxID=1005925 RepID=UPI0021D1B520|nr:TorF family putative porin [Kordiimonas aestuarii]